MKTEHYKVEDIQKNLQEHIIRGDRSDGIPNIHSPDNSFVAGIRQKPIKTNIVCEMLADPQSYCERNNIKQNYERNTTLIDFDSIPSYIEQRIIDKYNQIKRPITNIFTNGKHKHNTITQ
jgi:hypothetical protein